jgi:hypothetical protein
MKADVRLAAKVRFIAKLHIPSTVFAAALRHFVWGRARIQALQRPVD